MEPARGVETLSDAELVDALLCARRRALGQGSALLAAYGELSLLAQASPLELTRAAGLSPSAALRLAAAFELGRRSCQRVLRSGERIATSADLYAHFHPRLAHLRQERFYAVLLDGKGRMLRAVRISEGTLTASLVHPREVFRPAVRESAAQIALVHNHPSGDPSPSPEDLALTNRLRSVGETLGVRVVDHVVIGHGAYVSFVDSGRF